MGKYLVIAGAVLIGLGALLVLGERVGLGKLPGDLVWKRNGTTLYFPIVTSIVLSVVLTIVLRLLGKK